jgi:hypothetical protein
MNESLQQFVGKQCTIMLSGMGGSSTKGVVKSVDGNWLAVDTGKGISMVNADYIIRIQQK